MNLSDISFPKTLKSISESAFEGCAIQHLSLLGTSLEEIGKSAFQSCTQLVTVSLPASVATIGYSAFGNCPALQSIEVDAANDNYLSDDGILFNKSKTTLVSFPGAIQGVYSLPSSVEIILEKAFNGSNIHSVEIMNSNLKIISAYAFLYCKRLTSIMIPASVEIIGNYSFSHSTSLIEVVCFSSTPIPIQRNHFYNIELENCILRVPSASLQKYRQADVWKEFGSIVALDEAALLQLLKHCCGTASAVKATGYQQIIARETKAILAQGLQYLDMPGRIGVKRREQDVELISQRGVFLKTE